MSDDKKVEAYIETDKDGGITGIAAVVGDFPPGFRGMVTLSCNGHGKPEVTLSPFGPTTVVTEPPHEFIPCGDEQCNCCANNNSKGEMCCGSDDDEVHTEYRRPPP